MPSYIPPDFTPSPDTINKLRKKGIFPDFLEAAVDDAFRCYWTEQKEKKLAAGKKSSWQTTYYTWAVRASQGKVGIEWEKNRHRRESHGKGFKGDFFGEALDTLTIPGGLKKEARDFNSQHPLQKANPELVRNNPQRPGPSMSAEAAFEELRKMKII